MAATCDWRSTPRPQDINQMSRIGDQEGKSLPRHTIETLMLGLMVRGYPLA